MTYPNYLRTVRLLAVGVAAAALWGCAFNQTKVVDDWQSDEPVNRKPQKVAVIAVLPEALLREAFEVDVAKLLADKGTPAVPSSRIPGMSGGIRGEIDVEVATGLLRQANVDGVIVMFYSGGGNTEVTYVPITGSNTSAAARSTVGAVPISPVLPTSIPFGRAPAGPISRPSPMSNPAITTWKPKCPSGGS